MITTFTAVQCIAPILSHKEIAPRHYCLKLQASAIAHQARAGQFVHVLPRNSISPDPLLRRAFSISKVDGEIIELLYRIEGRGTLLMSHWHSGDHVDLIGPLGNGFAALPAPPKRAILVGGGVGVPPLSMLASTRAEDQKLLALIGARSTAEVLCQEDFASYNVPIKIATDDGSFGHHGFVTDLLTVELNADSHAVVFACGPLPMLKAVAHLCAQFDVPCQVSLEENMPCGVGVCNGCVVGVHGAGDDYGRYRRICMEGPVIWANEIDWGRLAGGGCP
jgi:dihydroorotate dehydrogenase electron transfer subunit